MGSPSCSASCATAALPPVDLTPLLLVAFPGLLWLDEGSAGAWASFRLGYAFGFGFFISGLYWIAAALFVDIGQLLVAVPIAAAGLPAALALYSGAGAVLVQISRSDASGCRHRADARLCDRVGRGGMDPRSRVYRASLEFDRLCLVRRVSRRDSDVAERRLGRHLWPQLSDCSRRLDCPPCSATASLSPISTAGVSLRSSPPDC